MVFLDRELALQKFQKQRGNSPRCVYLLLVKLRGWLHFHGKVQEFKKQVAQHIVLVDVIGSEFFKHPLENALNAGHLLVRQFKHMLSIGLENRVLV